MSCKHQVAIEAWIAADRACEELISSDADIMPADEFNARIKALHAAQAGLYAAVGQEVDPEKEAGDA